MKEKTVKEKGRDELQGWGFQEYIKKRRRRRKIG